MKKEEVTQELLKSVLVFNPETGNFTRKYRPMAGHIIGSIGSGGYVYIRMKALGLSSNFLAHRLAWLYMTGEWPPLHIDHKDGDRANNRWNNLRLATRADNARNRKRRSDNTSGFKGVSWSKKAEKWIVTIKIHGKSRCVGSFNDLDMARRAYAEAIERHHGEFANNGER